MSADISESARPTAAQLMLPAGPEGGGPVFERLATRLDRMVLIVIDYRKFVNTLF
jgi:hypothetical protein